MQEGYIGIVVDECPSMECITPRNPIDWMDTGGLVADSDNKEMTGSAECFW